MSITKLANLIGDMAVEMTGEDYRAMFDAKHTLLNQQAEIARLNARVAELERPVVFGGDVLCVVNYALPNTFLIRNAIDQSAQIDTPTPEFEYDAPVVAQFVFNRIESLDSVLATLTELRAKMAQGGAA